MNICKVFIKRPVATSIIMLALLIFGFFAYLQLPISELPNVDFPTIVVSASLPGADPQSMANNVATPLEKQLSTIADVDSMSSVSTAGKTQITLQFTLDRNIDAAAQDVQAALLQASKQLPSQMPNPPIVKKVNPADSPVLYLALLADHATLTQLDDYAENEIAPRLSMVPGVAQVNVYGAQQYAVRIHLNPYALTSRNLSIDTITQALQNLNSNQPVGTLQTAGHYQLIKVDGQLNNATDFSNAVIASSNGALVYLKDIATVQDSVANDKAATWYNNQRAIVLAIQRQPGANTIAVVNSITQLLPMLTSGLPGGSHLKIVYNRAEFIHAAVKDVQWTLVLAALLVVIVIFLFLRSISSTFIAILSLPISIIATFGVMYLLNQSLDNLSLMGLVLAVGFVVDDAIVVLENIMRHVEAGMDRMSASLQGAKEISFTVISMTLSLVAVFIPIFFMGGLIGRLFHEFACVVGAAILLSGVVALTLIPTLCSRFISKHDNAHHQSSHFERFFQKTKLRYEKSLSWSFQHQRIMAWIALGILILTCFLFYLVPKGFIPSQDTGIIFGSVSAPEGVTYPDFLGEQQLAKQIIQSNQNVTDVISSVGQGAGAVSSGNTGRFVIRLKPNDQRSLSADKIIQQLRSELSNIPGLKIYLTNPPAIQIGGKSSNSTYQYVLQSVNWTSLVNASQALQQKIAKLPGIQDVNSDLQLNNPELHLQIYRDKAALLGITPAQIEGALYSAYGERQISSIMTASGNYEVIMDIDPQYQQDLNALNSLTIKAANNTMVPISSLVHISDEAGPLSIGHYGQLPAITLSFNLAPNASLGKVTSSIEGIAKTTLPSDVNGTFAGSAKTFQSSFKTLPLLLFFTVLIIYMVLAILYEHFGHPLTILTALPFAAFGALFALILCNQELNIFSFIGLIMLVGLTKKNGIIMIDFALDAQREKALSAETAMLEACSVRFRPIMMTTVAAIVASLPIALGIGAGGEARQALGVAVVGGLIFSQLITLYITPLFYLWMDRFSQKILLLRSSL